jgi:uncharacterized membrane protein
LGEIVGSYTDADGVQHGFIRKVNGSFVTFSVPNSVLTVATGIDAAGEVVGEYAYWDGGMDGTYLQLGFRRSVDGTFTTIPIGDFGLVEGVNAKGQVTGSYLSEEEVWNGFVQQPDGSLTTFAAVPSGDNPGEIGTRPMAINATGEIVGFYDDTTTNVEHGFIRQTGGTIVSFDVPGATIINPMAINAFGEIVGVSNAGGFVRRASGQIVNLGAGESPVAINDRGEIAESCTANAACVREPFGTVYRFVAPNSSQTTPNAINDRGEIAGTYLDGSKTAHGFLVTNKWFAGLGF